MVIGLLSGVLLSACTTPPPLSPLSEELARQNQALSADLPGHPLTVEDAVALAVRHNLDDRVKQMEQAVAAGKADLSLFALLPKIGANAAITQRDRPNLVRSQDVTSGLSSTDATTSEDAFRHTADLTASWNLIDFGIALVRSDQEEERARQSAEKRRRALHQLVQDVQAAYWKAAINEFAERKYALLEVRLLQSVQDAEGAERSRVGDPMQMLSHQRAIIDTMRQIAELQRQTASARAELAGLIGAASPALFQLVALDEQSGLEANDLARPVEEMEAFALDHRPELLGEAAQFRIDLGEIHTEMLKTLPGIGPFIGAHGDSNSYLVNGTWADAGVKVAWNLVDLLSAPRRFDQARAVAEATRTRRTAIAMAVVTQVHVAEIQYRHALREYRLSDRMGQIDARIADLAGRSRQVGSGSPMEEIRATAASMLSALRRFVIYADLRAARARLDTAMGLDPAGMIPLGAKPEAETAPSPGPAPVPAATPSPDTSVTPEAVPAAAPTRLLPADAG